MIMVIINSVSSFPYIYTNHICRNNIKNNGREQKQHRGEYDNGCHLMWSTHAFMHIAKYKLKEQR